jgi:hypothetical protein
LSRPQVRWCFRRCRKPWVEIAMKNGEIRVDQCSKTSMFNVLPRVLGNVNLNPCYFLWNVAGWSLGVYIAAEVREFPTFAGS